MKIAVVSPHRDDAAFSLGLSVEAWLRAGHTVQVLNCCTRSAYAPFAEDAMVHENDRASFVSALRRREDAAWNKLLENRVRFTDLDLLDAPLRLACGVDEVLAVPVRAGDRAVARVAGALAKLARTATAGTVAVALPLALGGHIDHRVVRQAGLEALGGTELPVAFYEDLPYAARPGATEEIAPAVAETGWGLMPGWATEAVEGEALALRVRRKHRMAECYDTQVEATTVEEIAHFCERYGGRERMWGNAAWRAWAGEPASALPAADGMPA